MNKYRGFRGPYNDAIVMKNDQLLPLCNSLLIRSHSPTGFNWGYGGSGPAQLALALLLEETDEEKARVYYQRFKREVVAGWQRDSWEFSSHDIKLWLDHAFWSDESKGGEA